jgi:hypothetical protein
MGWGRMMLLGNVGQQMDISDLSQVVGRMRTELAGKEYVDRAQGRDIEQLKRENHELKLYLATIVRLLVTKGVVKPEEVETIVKAIDTE